MTFKDLQIGDPGERITIWFATAGGGLAWFAHFISIYILAEFGCIRSLDRLHLWNFTSISWAIIAVTVIMVCLSCASTWAARRYKRILRLKTDHQHESSSRQHFADICYYTNGFFVVIITVQTIPVIYFLRSC